MSWTMTVPAGPADSFRERAEAALAERQPLQGGDAEAESRAQAAEAIEAAVEIIDSGKVGDGEVSALFSGHANPGHTPREGYANDTLTVGVSAAVAAPPTT